MMIIKEFDHDGSRFTVVKSGEADTPRFRVICDGDPIGEFSAADIADAPGAEVSDEAAAN